MSSNSRKIGSNNKGIESENSFDNSSSSSAMDDSQDVSGFVETKNPGN